VLCTLVTALHPGAMSGQEDQSRSIVPEAFLKARPAASKAATKGGATYRRVGRVRIEPQGAAVSEIGVTIWKLRPADSSDTTRLLVQEPQGAAAQWTPVRVEAGTPLAIGDRLRISVESPRDGYLYVIDRERYADGSTGDPYLIFPTTRARGGDNRVTGGRLIEIPAQTDAPPYFTLQPSRANQVAELITVLIARAPLPGITPGAGPVVLGRDVVAAWEKEGGAIVDQLEMVGGAGRTWSAEEQRAGADATRLLMQHDPPPQTLFRVMTTNQTLVAAQFSLSHAAAGAVSSDKPR
jgi:hypothetical protein